VLRRAGVVYAKEIREMLRDWRVVVTAVISPFALVMITFLGFAVMANDIEAQPQGAPGPPAALQGEVRIGIVTATGSSGLVERLRRTVMGAADAGMQVSLRYYPDLGVAQGALSDGEVSAVVVPPEGGDEAVAAEQRVAWTVESAAGSTASSLAEDVAMAALARVEQEVLRERLERRQMTVQAADPFRVIIVQPAEAALPAGVEAPSLLGILLPYIMVLAAFFGGVPAAFDTVAGEKERGTLETMLVSPVRRGSLVFGKFLSVFTVCTVAALSALLGILVAINGRIGLLEPVFGEAQLPLRSVAVILLAFLPLNVCFAGLLLVVSTLARNQKEAQTYLMPLTFLVVFPAMFTLFRAFEGSDVNLALAWVPVYSSSTLIRMVLEQGAPVLFVIFTLASSTLYAALALWLAARLFRRESVLMRI
jgi:sodium transport system permease protein